MRNLIQFFSVIFSIILACDFSYTEHLRSYCRQRKILFVCILLISNLFATNLIGQVDSDADIQKRYIYARDIRHTQPDKSILIFDSLIIYGQENNNIKLAGHASGYKATVLINQRKLEEAKTACAYTLKLGLERKDSLLIVGTYGNLGDIAKIENSIDDAILNYEKSLSYMKDSIDQMKVYNDLGQVLSETGKFNEAIEYYFMGLEMIPYGSPPNFKGIFYNSLGNAFRKIKSLDKSLEYFTKAEELLENSKDIDNYCVVLNNISDVLSKKGDYTGALKRLEKSLALNKERKDSISMTYSLFGLGEVYFFMENYNKAISYFSSSYKIENKFNAHYEAMTSLNQIARSYFMLNDFKQAKRFVDMGLEKSALINRPTETFELKKLAFEIDLKSMNGGKLYPLYEEISMEQDSVYKKSNINAINEIEAKYTKAQDQQKIAEQNLEIEKQETANQRKNAGIAGLLLLGGVGGFLVNRFRKKNQEIKLLNRELSHRVKNNLEFISSLLKLQSRDLKDAGSKEALKDSENRIQALSSVYKRLYGDDGIVPINLQEYLTELTQNLKETYRTHDRDLKIEMYAKELLIPAEKATKIGLIVNELVTNSIKYAFLQQDNPVIKVKFKKNMDELMLSFSDNGVGLERNDDDAKQGQSFGLGLVEKLVKQLNGKMLTKNEAGLTYDFSFKNMI